MPTILSPVHATIVFTSLLFGLTVWYIFKRMSYGITGGNLGRHPYFFAFECFWEEALCFVPTRNAKERRIAYIKKHIGLYGEGFILTYPKSFSHTEIRRNKNYEEVFWAMKGSTAEFWLNNLALFIIPASIYLCIGIWFW